MLRTPHAAFAAQLWWRHRWEFMGSIAGLLGLAAICPFVFALSRETSVHIAVAVPIVMAFSCFMTALLFADEAGSLTSGYARRMYSLPVSTPTLVFWPMLYGAATLALLWAATAGLIYRPNGFQTPVLLPAMGLAAAFAWIQAMTWAPLGFPLGRIVLVGPVLATIVGLPIWLLATGRVSETALTILLFASLPFAYLLARVGVACDRRGDAWWPQLAAKLPAFQRKRSFQPKPAFSSIAQAQFWFEWRCFGLVAPVFVGVTIAALLPATTVVANAGPGYILLSLAAILGMPLLLCGSLGEIVGRVSPFTAEGLKEGRLRGGASPAVAFLALRPMTSGMLVATKFRAALLSVLATWALVLLIAACWTFVSGNVGRVAELEKSLSARFSTGQAMLLIALTTVTAIGYTWKQLTDNVAAGLLGRYWVGVVLAIFMVACLMSFVAGGLWLAQHPADLARFLTALPYLIVGAGALKISIAFAAFRAAWKRRLVEASLVREFLIAWLVVAASALALVAILLADQEFPTSKLVPFASVLISLPLARFAIAPLAFDANRHR